MANRPPGWSGAAPDPQALLDATAEAAARLCDAPDAWILRAEGDRLRLVAGHGARRPPKTADAGRPIRKTTAHGRAFLEGRTVQLGADVATPLGSDGAPLGVIVLRRATARPLTGRQVDGLEAFAAQATIALRLLEACARELTETLSHQAAAGEIVRAISASPTEMRRVFDMIAENAVRLCDGQFGGVFQFDGQRVHLLAQHGLGAEGIQVYARAFPRPAGRDSAIGRAILDRAIVHISDVRADPEYGLTALAATGSMRCIVAVPVLREGQPIGGVVAWRAKPEPFSDKQIALLKTFADQTLIAIENTRLVTALEARNRDLTEALEQQTATSEILRIISTSPTDLQPVLETVAENAARLCAADDGHIWQREGNELHLVASWGGQPTTRRRLTISRQSVTGRAALDRRAVHVADLVEVLSTEFPDSQGMKELGYRTILAVPLLREGVAIGAIMIRRSEVRPFTDKQLELVRTFADQAVIAIENVRLFRELETRNRDLTETLEQQTATGDILRVISSSPTDVQPVFDTIAQNARRLCDAEFCAVFRYDGQLLHFVAHDGVTAEGVEAWNRLFPVTPGRGSGAGRAVLSAAVQQIPDVAADPEYSFGELARIVTFRSLVAVPILRDGRPIGAITVNRSQTGLLPARQLELLKTFADQAVIAIENVRLFTELEVRNRDLTETLEQQTATGDILRVISSSPTDVQPVFDTIAESAARLCEARDVSIWRRTVDQLLLVTHHGPIAVGVVGERTLSLARGTGVGRSVLDGRTVHVTDVQAQDAEFPETSANARREGFRTMLVVPLMREGVAIGAISLRRVEAQLFTERQVRLLETFADQAVIAVQNVRLFQELEAKNRDLTDSLEQQTATGEILRVISSSPTDAQPVFDIIARNAVRLCQAAFAYVFRYDGTLMHVVAHHNLTSEALAALERQWPMRPDPRSVPARAVLERRVIHVEDVLDAPDHPYLATSRALGIRTMLTVPMMREGEPIGAIAVYRQEVQAFSEHQIGLVATFASQAVIAIENVRLFKELEARNRDLTETLEQQTATGEILRVISSSPTDVQPVFDTIARSALRLCDARWSAVTRYDGHLIQLASHHGLTDPAGIAAIERAFPRPPSPHGATDRAITQQAVGHYPDVREDPDYQFQDLARAAGYRSMLAVPMVREGQAVGAITVAGATARTFSDRQIELLKTFADQAVIAIENVRLFRELETRNRDLTETLEQQTATSDILRVISSSPTDAQPVFETIARSAKQLCDAEFCVVFRFDGQLLHFVAHHGLTAEGAEVTRGAFPAPADRGSAAGRAMLSANVQQIPDVTADPEYAFGAVARVATFRSIVAVPMLRDGVPIGAITVRRVQDGLLPDRQISLLQTFADQAVIAVENVRLFQELEVRNRDLVETLEQKTATSEILRVISSSPTDAQPVFDIIGERAKHLCDAAISVVSRFDGELLHLVSLHGVAPAGADAIRSAFPMRPDDETISARVVKARAVVHVADVLADVRYGQKGTARAGGYRGCLGVPMVREGQVTGVIFVARTRPGLFADAQVELLKTFADQAVIAVENVRLFQELDARNRDLTETLEQQTATGDILRVISSSPTDAQPVFDTIAESAKRLCGAEFCLLYRYDGTLIHFVAHHGLSPEAVDAVRRAYPMAPARTSAAARSILSGLLEHIPDVDADSDYRHGALARTINFKSIVAVPMVRDGIPIGTITVARVEAGPFPDRQLELLKTFADQAVIAIENVRLFQELDARTHDLTRSVGELRALGEVSQAVSSTLDLEAVLETIVTRAVELSGSYAGIVYEFEESTQSFRARATHHITPEHLAILRASPIRLGEGAMGRAGVSRAPVQVADIADERQLVASQVRGLMTRQGMRSLLALPLVREGSLLGGLVIIRLEQGAFAPEVVATLQTFATQSVLAIHNAGLFREIQRQKQYADAIVETSPVAIVTLDLAGTIVGWNPGAQRLFGYTPAEALGRRMEDLVATPDGRDEVRANIDRTLGGEWIRAIGRRARKDGTPVDVEISSVPVVVDGARMGMIGIYHDITDLLRARREAETANEAKSAFLATMSHEIRTPMNAVIGMSGLLLGTPLNDEQREYAEIVRQSGDALLTVINDILDFSKIEAGKLELEAQPFDLRECVESAVDLVAARATEKGLDLAYLVGDGTPALVVGDVTRLRQVLLNLLSNAVKFTERGEVVLSVATHRPDDPAAPPELTFSVRDTGIGIAPDRVGRLFQSFSQVDASTTRRYGGTGLGLAISQRLTELMGGRIGVTSEVGVGSDFRFTIRAPVAEGPLPARRDLSGVQPSLRGKQVLVVDDNATNRRIVTTHLDAWGMQARATGSPGEALGWIQADERFDLAILDMHMPEMDGVALARALRAHPAGAALPLVLFTSLGRREARAEEEGFAAYLHKPIKPSQLFDALVTVLAERPVHVPEHGVGRGDLDPDLAARHPLRILLAEDNVVNQKVALRLLGQMGYRADVAANGLEAVDAVGRQRYDVVLMDVQMPELDGFEASREINRRWPGSRRPRIVAMTANAMQGDRELCAAAGMDDYVAKPIRVEELVAALERSPRRADAPARAEPSDAGRADGAVRRPRRRPSGSPAAATAAPGADRAPAGAIDRPTFDRLAATMGGPFLAELIGTFLEDAPALVVTLRAGLAASDVDVFRRAAHSLKSNCDTLGALGLAALARDLETRARAGTLAGAEDRVTELAGAYDAVARELEDLRHDLPA